MSPVWLVVALLAGAVLPLQTTINARLGVALGGPLWGALVSFCVGTVALAVVLAARRPAWPSAAGIPVWAWCGLSSARSAGRGSPVRCSSSPAWSSSRGADARQLPPIAEARI